MSLTANQISGFVQAFLLSRYDNPVPIPTFHKEMWEMCCSGHNRVAIAAPRYHAKSTAITHAFTLASVLFRERSYVLIVSDTESQASQFLGDIKTELLENEDIREVFGVKQLVKDAITDIIIEMNDGHQFRIQALGAEQKVRGRKWNNKRPDLIVVDDLENDEMVESDERREKLRNWFLKALIPSLAKHGLLVDVGTILHMDSILMRLMRNKSFFYRLYKAHEAFDDFSNILWVAQWPEPELRRIRQEYIDEGYSEGYAQEYLNDPIAHSEAYFKKEDFKEIDDNMKELPTYNYAGVDLAISDADRAAYTVIVVGGMDTFGRLMIKHVVRFRGDGNQIVDTMLQIQKAHSIELWKIEDGQIKMTLRSELLRRMEETGIYLNILPATPTKDKRSRARAIQARMRAGGVYFDKTAPWYAGFEQELLQFPKGLYKDQVDAIAWLGIAISELAEGPSDKELEDEEYERMKEESFFYTGANEVTGY